MIEVVGTNHELTRLGERERLVASTLSSTELCEHARQMLYAQEVIALRTCNRVEIYYLSSVPSVPSTVSRRFIAASTERANPLTENKIYHFTGIDAVKHLFKIACGLNSAVLGENEILHQLKQAFAEAQSACTIDTQLSRLFQHALRTGRRARRETGISQGVFSIGECAVQMAAQHLVDLKDKRILLIGAGQVAKSIGKELNRKGVASLIVLGRTKERARRLTQQLGAKAVDSQALINELARADLVVGCSNAPHYLIRSHHIFAARQIRRGKPLVIIDLGVPRNIDPAVGRFPDITLTGLEALYSQINEFESDLSLEIERVIEIIAEETTDFLNWQKQFEVRTSNALKENTFLTTIIAP